MRSISTLLGGWRKPRLMPGSAGIHPALRRFGRDAAGTVLRLAAYVGALALIGAMGAAFIDGLPVDAASEPAAKSGSRSGFSVAARSIPAFAVSGVDMAGRPGTYEVLRHLMGGRKDVIRWAAPGETPVAELELYRPGSELHDSGPALDLVAARMDPDGSREIEPAGVVASKFGTIMVVGFAGQAGQPDACLGFMTQLGDANLRLSGYSCQGDSQPARRAAISCLLNRIVLLSAGGDPKLADRFARAELRRSGSCSTPAAGDWSGSVQMPRLRGSL